MIAVLDSFWRGRTKLASAGLAAALAACGTPAPPVATAPDVTGADSEIAEPADTAVSEIADVGDTADTEITGALDASGPDGDAGPADSGVEVGIFYPDCSAPQTEGCPCTAADAPCCISQSYGLTCQTWKDSPTWSAFSDCCRDPNPSCKDFNLTPQPGWCNGKAP